MITKNIQNLKIQKLSNEQYEKALAEDLLDDESIYLTPKDDYTNKEIDNKLKNKADLIDGKVPLSQLPDNIGNGGGGSQIQVDYNQNDETQLDYIKNRPFYTIPPETSFNFNFYRSRESISWDGII